MNHLGPLPAMTLLVALLHCALCYGASATAQLASPAPATRLMAIQSLGSNDDAVAPLVSALKHDSSPEATWAAARALASIGDASISPLCAMLHETLQSYDPARDYYWAAWGCRYKDQSGPWRRWCAAWALAHVSGSLPVDSLISALDSRDWAVRAEAGLALVGQRPIAGQRLARLFDNLPRMSQARAMWVLMETHDREAARLALQVVAGPLRCDTLFEWQSIMGGLTDRLFRETGSDGLRQAAGLLEGPESLDVDRAVSALGRADKNSVPALVSALTSRNHRVRWAAAGAVEQLGDSAALVPLARQMDDSMRYIAEEAARRIARLGGMKAEGLLAERLQDARPRMRFVAAQGLAIIGSRKALAPLTMALLDSSYKVRADAAAALGTLGDTSAVPALRALENDQVWEVRNHSLWARAKLGDSTATERLIAQCKEPSQGSPMFSRGALGALRHIKTQRATRALIEMLEDQSGQYKVDKTAVVAELVARPDSAAKAALAAQYARHSMYLADTTVVRIGPEVADAVAADMTSAHGFGRIHYARLLHQMGDPRGEATLHAMLMGTTAEDSSQWARQVTARAIVETGDKQLGKILLSARQRPGWARAEVYDALAKLKSPGTGSALVSDLSSSPELRGCIVDALDQLGDTSVLSTLDSLAATGSADERLQAARTMLRLAPHSAVPHLVSLLSEQNTRVVTGAARALGEVGDKRAVRTLVSLLQSQDPEIRFEALAALARTPAADAIAARRLRSTRSERDWYAAYPVALRHNEARSEAMLLKLLIERGSEAMVKEYGTSSNPTLRHAASVWSLGQECAWRLYDMTRPPMLR
jgi:HEAT repeat protein